MRHRGGEHRGLNSRARLRIQALTALPSMVIDQPTGRACMERATCVGTQFLVGGCSPLDCWRHRAQRPAGSKNGKKPHEMP